MNESRKSRILADCLEAIESGDAEKKDRLLLRYPSLAGEINGLIDQADSMRNLPDFRIDEITERSRKTQLVAKLPPRDHAVTKTSPFRLNRQKTEWRFTMTWVVIIATIISLMSGAGVVYASGDALPGDALYPVKMLVEDAQLALSPDLVDAELRIRFADHRISELVELLDEGRVGDAGLALSGYQNQTELLTRLFSRIEAANPEDAVQLRAELQSKLQEQAMRMQTVAEGSGEMVRETVQAMLQTNTELRSRLQSNTDVPDSGDDLPETDSETTLEGQQVGPGNGQENDQKMDQGQSSQSGKGIALAGVYQEDNKLRFTFSGDALEGQAYYLEIGGMRQDCSAGSGMITCTMNQVMQQGTANLYDKATNTLLFQYTFDYSNQFQNGMMKNDDTNQDRKDGDQGQNGKK